MRESRVSQTARHSHVGPGRRKASSTASAVSGSRPTTVPSSSDALSSRGLSDDAVKKGASLESLQKNLELEAPDHLTEHQSQASQLKVFLEGREGSCLRAWLHHFDTNNDQKISLHEFMRGMRGLNFSGDPRGIFDSLDVDGSGELSLEEIDAMQASVWKTFAKWCVGNFDGPGDMIQQLAGNPKHPVEKVDMNQFAIGLQWLGWQDGCEDLLYESMDSEGKGLGPWHLKWLEIEKRRQRRKEAAKRRAQQQDAFAKRNTAKERKAMAHALAEFKTFLKRKFGNFVRAWRRVLSHDGSLSLKQNELWKACSVIGWPGDVRRLWQAFDKDGSGDVSIEELDPKGAEILAHFRKFIHDKFGGATDAFRALDKYNMKKVRREEFLAALKFHGFNHPAKTLFQGLDYLGHKSIILEDLFFLDKWKPPAFLVAQKNFQAAEELKELLLRHHKNFLKAWRHCLDPDGSNRCNWGEFEASCQKIGFTGDVAGAWRALDDDLSGFITLHEIHPPSSMTLGCFKSWADEEFGGVRSAFGVFDNDGSNEVSFREFKRACRAYGFNYDVKTVFQALDVERNGSLSLDEVTFLDDWDFAEQTEVEEEAHQDEVISKLHPGSGLAQASATTEYITDGPGPAAYTLKSTIGVGPLAPTLKFSGAYTFRRRPQTQQLPGIARDASDFPGPDQYNAKNSAKHVSISKPTWSFGTAPRLSNVNSVKTDDLPGPGHYAPNNQGRQVRHGPAAHISPRRPLKVHPLYFSDRSVRPYTASGAQTAR
mmetsp:Transcript_130469/g.230586  ORF Transcript_130469/g.230586 Transcript_130469/m.230586 type:complete len:766 (-) Transcript_130469:9-2306(-)